MLRDVAMATNFRLSMAYNFGCMIARDRLFDSRGGLSYNYFQFRIKNSRHIEILLPDGGRWRRESTSGSGLVVHMSSEDQDLCVYRIW